MTRPSSEFLNRWIDQHFTAECQFLAAMVRVPTDNPPGDCARHAAVARADLEALGLRVQSHPVPAAEVKAVGMISAVNLLVRVEFGSGPCIALNAHGDVVPPGQGWKRTKAVPPLMKYVTSISSAFRMKKNISLTQTRFHVWKATRLILKFQPVFYSPFS